MNKKLILGLLLIFSISLVYANQPMSLAVYEKPISVIIDEEEETSYNPPIRKTSKDWSNLDKFGSYTFFGRGKKSFICNGQMYYFDHHLLWDRVLYPDGKQVSSSKVYLLSKEKTFGLDECKIGYKANKWIVTIWKEDIDKEVKK